MAKNKVGLNFKGFEEYAERLDKLGGDIKKATEKALQATHDHITPNLERDIKPHSKTGRTERSLNRDAKVKWVGSTAGIEVGFKLDEGGLPSIFLMYGTPRMKKDQQLYNDIFGGKTKKEIAEIQQKIFMEEIKKTMEG